MNSTSTKSPTPQTSRFLPNAFRNTFDPIRLLTQGPHAALFLFLLSIYLLTYTPRINSSDGLAMFATAESLVRRGAVDIEQIRWMGLQQGTYGLDGLLYSRKGIGLPFGLLPLTWLGLVVPWFGPVGVSLLFNALVTALTAVVLLAYLQQLGFTQRTGFIVALTFGLATLAWPYAKSLFSDPLAGFLLLTSAYLLLKASRGPQARPVPTNSVQQNISPAPLLPRSPAHLLPLFLAGLLLSWNVATRYAEAIFLPIFGLLLLSYLSRTTHHAPRTTHHAPRTTHHALPLPHNLLTALTAFTAPMLLTGLGLISFNISRYGDPFNTGYLPNETFSGSLGEGIVGQLVSPGRGLLLYCPVLILSLAGIIPFFRRLRAETIVALSIIISHLLLYGKWFMWHGGFAWGPRFMVPTLPFWAMFLAPVVERALVRAEARGERGDTGLEVSAGSTPKAGGKLSTPRSRNDRQGSRVGSYALRSIFMVLVTAGFIFQLLMVTTDFSPFQDELLETGLPLFARQTVFDPRYSPLIGAWTYIAPHTLDLAWAWQGRVNWGLLAILATNVVVTGFHLKGRLATGGGRLKQGRFPLPYFTTLIALVWLLIHTHALPARSLQEAVATLNEIVRPADAVITNDPEIAMPLAELYKGRAAVLGLNNGGFPLPDDITRRLNEIISRHPQVWWLPNWLPPESSAIEQTLLAGGFRARHENFDEQRLVLFAYPGQLPAQTGSIMADFDRLINLVEVAYPTSTTAGVALPVELRWQATAAVTQDYHVFIHLLDQQGQLVAQADGQPAHWTRPTSTWAVGELVVDRHGLWIPTGTAPGVYQLNLGLYRPEDGQRLPLADGQGSIKLELQIE